jgi:YVTN family beta-propeller protein
MQNVTRDQSALRAHGFAAMSALVMMGATAWPGEVVAWTGRPLAYLATFVGTGDSRVEVIDTGSNSLVATVPIAHEVFARGAAVTPDGKRVYVVNGGDYPNFDGSVSMIDTASLTVTASIPGFHDLSAVAVAPDGKHVYVTTSGGPSSADVSVIDTASNEVHAPLLPARHSAGLIRRLSLDERCTGRKSRRVGYSPARSL